MIARNRFANILSMIEWFSTDKLLNYQNVKNIKQNRSELSQHCKNQNYRTYLDNSKDPNIKTIHIKKSI